jgi:hypothetical protein
MKKLISLFFITSSIMAGHCNDLVYTRTEYFNLAKEAIAQVCPMTAKYETLTIAEYDFSSWDTDQEYEFIITGDLGNGHDVDDTVFKVLVEGECHGGFDPDVTKLEVLGNCQ